MSLEWMRQGNVIYQTILIAMIVYTFVFHEIETGQKET